jgi:hypothetical protein
MALGRCNLSNLSNLSNLFQKMEEEMCSRGIYNPPLQQVGMTGG